MKTKAIIFLLFLSLCIIGCTSVPEIRSAHYVDKNKYDVVIDRDYMNNPLEFKYALNTFVKENGGTSYSLEKYGSNDFYVTIPGDIPVEEDLPKIRHFHVGRTIGATLPPTIGAILLLLIFLL